MLVPLIFPTLDDDHLIFFMIIFIHSKSIIIHYSTSQQMIRPIIVASKKEFRFVVLLLQHKSTRSVDLKTNGLDPDKPHFPRENVQACATTMSPYSSFFSTINFQRWQKMPNIPGLPAYNNGGQIYLVCSTPYRQISKENQTSSIRIVQVMDFIMYLDSFLGQKEENALGIGFRYHLCVEQHIDFD